MLYYKEKALCNGGLPVYYVTQDEYNALSPEGKNADVIYATPGNGQPADGTCWEVYSEEERRIGTWIDGKPIYRKVVMDLDVPTSPAYLVYPCGIEGLIDTAIKCRGYVKYGTGSKLNYITSNYVSDGGKFLCGIWTTSNEIWIENTLEGPKGKKCFVILEYTKQKD